MQGCECQPPCFPPLSGFWVQHGLGVSLCHASWVLSLVLRLLVALPYILGSTLRLLVLLLVPGMGIFNMVWWEQLWWWWAPWRCVRAGDGLSDDMVCNLVSGVCLGVPRILPFGCLAAQCPGGV
ncbi:hypothetical protein V8C86DRAFT_1683070 [Haematococcus lacustris]